MTSTIQTRSGDLTMSNDDWHFSLYVEAVGDWEQMLEGDLARLKAREVLLILKDLISEMELEKITPASESKAELFRAVNCEIRMTASNTGYCHWRQLMEEKIPF